VAAPFPDGSARGAVAVQRRRSAVATAAVPVGSMLHECLILQVSVADTCLVGTAPGIVSGVRPMQPAR
jgi:hypothetical protein